MALSKGVYSKDDCGKLKIKDSNHTRRSKENTYHVVNKNIAPSEVTDNVGDEREDAFRGIPKLSCLFLLECYLGLAWGSPKLRLFLLLIPSSIVISPKT